MDKFRAQSLRFGTKIITETVSKVDLSARPFRYWREFQEDQEPETADTLIIATGASAKRLHLKGEDIYWQSGISACAVCDGAVPIFRNKPLAVIGGGDSAAEEAQAAGAATVTPTTRSTTTRTAPHPSRRPSCGTTPRTLTRIRTRTSRTLCTDTDAVL